MFEKQLSKNVCYCCYYGIFVRRQVCSLFALDLPCVFFLTYAQFPFLYSGEAGSDWGLEIEMSLEFRKGT